MKQALRWLSLGARILVGGLFVYAGASKILRPPAYFEIAISGYELLPESLITAVALVLPWAEVALGAFLQFGLFVESTTIALSVLTFLFQAFIAQAILRQLPMSTCGCYGGAGGFEPTLRQALLIDTGILFLLLALLSDTDHRYSVDRWLEGPRPK